MSAGELLSARDCLRNADVWSRFTDRHARLSREARTPGQRAYHAAQRVWTLQTSRNWRAAAQDGRR